MLEHALRVIHQARPIVDLVERRDRDLANQIRRAMSSVGLNLAEAFGTAGGNARLRFQTARGSLYEAQTGMRIAVAWGFIAEEEVTPVEEALNNLAGRIFGLARR